MKKALSCMLAFFLVMPILSVCVSSSDGTISEDITVRHAVTEVFDASRMNTGQRMSTQENPIDYKGYHTVFGPNELSFDPTDEGNYNLLLLCAMLSEAAYIPGGVDVAHLYRQIFDYSIWDSKIDYTTQNFCSSCAFGILVIDGVDTGVLFITIKGTDFELWEDGGGSEAFSAARWDTSEIPGYPGYPPVYNAINEFSGLVFQRLIGFWRKVEAGPFAINSDMPLKVIVTGHSLGGAAANLLAAELTIDAKQESGLWKSFSIQPEIYSYTFGSINSINTDHCITDGFENIHNIFNEVDKFTPGRSGWIVQGGMSSIYGKFGHMHLFNREFGDGNHDMFRYLEAVNNGDIDGYEDQLNSPDRHYYTNTRKDFASPELPDCIAVYSPSGASLLTSDNRMLPYYSACLANDGTLAIQAERGGDVKIYKPNQTEPIIIPAPIDYFMISAEGNKLIYGTTKNNTFFLDIDSREKKQISEQHQAYKITGNGNTVILNDDNPPIFHVSSDGSYTFFQEFIKNDDANSPERYKSCFVMRLNGQDHIIAEVLTGEQSEWNIAVYTYDYNEILFYNQDQLFYYSIEFANNGDFTAKPVQTDTVNIDLSSLAPVNRSNDPFGPERYAPAIMGYSLLYENTKGKKELVQLIDDFSLSTIDYDITGDVYATEIGDKLCFISKGELNFIHYSGDKFSRWAPGINIELELNEYAIYRGYDAFTVTSDGNNVYYIDKNNTIWHYTCSGISDSGISESSVQIAKRINHVLRAYDDRIYAFYFDEQSGTADFYLVDSSDNLHHVISNVYNWIFTKSNCYVWTYSDSMDRTDLYVLNGDSASLLMRDCWVIWDNLYRNTSDSVIRN